MSADKKHYSLDDIKPMSALSIEPANPISRSFEAEFSRIFGEPTPHKSRDVLTRNPDAVNLPKASADPREIAGLPREKTKSDILAERHPDVVRIPKARADRDEALGLPLM
ncbi:hypothetical protein [Pseudomonas amygdali]|uniref:Uncharacterized protein n=1 Tax=Pseudomonas amygdali pv. lachrymans str. M301315 TaxID=629260 RepID=A0AAD0PWA2_PSEAV|nr:hypothetical protein [Pseudomonas amygdali]AXH59938.1 hypothetical protein PLA107_032450 [Pseudomonas amygdali pv. lachrymans str. M301315]